MKPYQKNELIGAIPLTHRIHRVENGGPFEFPYMLELAKLATDFSKEKNVLDLGCGTGPAAYMMSKFANHITAIDPDSGSIEWAKQNRNEPNINYVIGTTDKILGSDNFDYITCLDVIEHIEDYCSLLNDINRLINENGLLFLTTPNRLRESENNLNPRNKLHVQEFSSGELYFILNMFFEEIKLFTLLNPLDKKTLIEVDINNRFPITIAIASGKRNINLNF